MKENYKSLKKWCASLLLLVGALMLSTITYAQQPACNLSGPLKGQHNKAGGNSINLKAEVSGAVQGTTYTWSFENAAGETTNTSGAVIVSGQGTKDVKVKAGTQGGSFAIKLTVKNPDGSTCWCIQSVSVEK